MKFEEYFDSMSDFEADYSLIKDAWEAGAYAMHEYLMPDIWLTNDEKKEIHSREVKKFMKKNG